MEKMKTVNGEELVDMNLPPARFCVDTLLPQGICILGGAPKVGKSWLVLDLCVRIAQGLPVWNLKTAQGTALYLCLEDTLRRVQDRLNSITDDPPAELYFAVSACSIADGLCEQIKVFCKEHPGVRLVAIDTFQLVRKSDTDISYGNDYWEVRQLKALTDELGISVLLVHHLRKQGDSDPLNKLSGTTGLSGAVDAVYVLDKDSRSQNTATLFCTGRDIESRELKLRFSSETCTWDLIADSLTMPEKLLPRELELLVAFMREQKHFSGGNSELAQVLSAFCGLELSAKALKQQMNRWRHKLEECGVFFDSYRSNGQRFVKIDFRPSASDGSAENDANIGSTKTCVTCVPCDPVPPA